ncbi:MAG: hypothetical protein WCE63_07980 [Acidobacteriaceae bacterium]
MEAKKMTVASYVDAAGSLSEIAIAPAAMVSTPEKWLEFEKEWNNCLAAYRVTELHMRHYAHSKGEYEGWKDDQPKRRRFLNNLMWIIENYVEFTASDAVYTRAYNEHDTQFQLSESMRPYTLGCLAVVGRVFGWGKERNLSPADFVWLFEKGDLDQGDLRKHWGEVCPDSSVEPIFLKKKDKFPDTGVCKRQRPFEAADLVAYENLKAHRLLDERGDEPVFEDELRRPLQRMKRWPGAPEWGYFGSEGIARVCDRYAIAARAKAL